MKLVAMKPRNNWQYECEKVGFTYHSLDNWWQENKAYEFKQKQIDEIRKATKECHAMMLETLDDVIKKDKFDLFQLPAQFKERIEQSWKNKDSSLNFSIYGRFDFSWNGFNTPKMLEYNADTPMCIIESGIVQGNWAKEVVPQCTQFNELHEKLVERWRMFTQQSPTNVVSFACIEKCEEDLDNLRYMSAIAVQAGVNTGIENLMTMQEIGLDENNWLVGKNNERIETMFKLYPWEWIMSDEFGKNLEAMNKVQWIEPMYKALLSCKAMLPLVWEKFKGHPNLLRAEFAPRNGETIGMSGFAKKPLFSREGANISLFLPNGKNLHIGGNYGSEGYIFQELALLPKFEDRYACIGSWVVGGEPVGIGIREDVSLVTRNTSFFVPHYIKD